MTEWLVVTCAAPGIIDRGGFGLDGPGQTARKQLLQMFFSKSSTYFTVLQWFINGLSGDHLFEGRGGVQMLISIPFRICEFPDRGSGSRTPPPLEPHLGFSSRESAALCELQFQDCQFPIFRW